HVGPPGRVLRLYVIPPRPSEAPSPPADPDWGRWLDPQTLGFDLSGLQPARSEWAPPCACDRQAAWTGTLPEHPDRPVRVEAGASRGRAVDFAGRPVRRGGGQGERAPRQAAPRAISGLCAGGCVATAPTR